MLETTMAEPDEKVALKSEYEQENPPDHRQAGTSVQPPPYGDVNLPLYEPPTMNQPYHHQQPEANQPYPLPPSQTFPFKPPQGAVGAAPQLNQPPQTVMVQPSHPVMVQPPVVTNVVHQVTTVALGSNPCSITCPTCHQNVITHVRRTLKQEAWCWCIILCLVGCDLCCWIPFVMDSNYASKHYCPKCRTFIGRAA